MNSVVTGTVGQISDAFRRAGRVISRWPALPRKSRNATSQSHLNGATTFHPAASRIWQPSRQGVHSVSVANRLVSPGRGPLQYNGAPTVPMSAKLTCRRTDCTSPPRHRHRRASGGLAGKFYASLGSPARSVVWVGSPVNGTWALWDGACPGATYPSGACSWPTVHHTYRNGMAHAGDWGADLGVREAGQDVLLYAAPNETSRTITAKVETVVLACGALSGETYEQTRARGGNAVVVGLYEGSTRIGWVTYTHVDPAVSAGHWISRWGTRVGTVGAYTANGCWTGVHLHVEMTNEANYSCFNRGWGSGQAMSRTNFIEFLGGAYRSAPRQPCP